MPVSGPLVESWRLSLSKHLLKVTRSSPDDNESSSCDIIWQSQFCQVPGLQHACQCNFLNDYSLISNNLSVVFENHFRCHSLVQVFWLATWGSEWIVNLICLTSCLLLVTAPQLWVGERLEFTSTSLTLLAAIYLTHLNSKFPCALSNDLFIYL